MSTHTIPRTAQAAGITYDLDRDLIDVYGARWTWTGTTDTDGTPFVQTGDDTPQRLTHVYWTDGPLIPAPLPVTYADRHAAFTTPACAATVSSATPHTVAALLGRFRRRAA
ncbi:phiSA1p31-related protein [Streptomyces nitrosporeus]|uniref:phiSA1p31-related protein n=1 Tax=Streptomyces nitrosporeus TaxID=28894 RepID=UPI0039A239A4